MGIATKYELKNSFNYKTKDEAGIVHGRDLNELKDELTDGTSTDFNVATATIGTLVGEGALTSTSATAGVGYATGAGIAVTQSTSITTAVDGANAMSGAVTTVSTTLAAAAEAVFTVNNSSVAATDVVIVNIKSTASAGTPVAYVTAVAAGSFDVTLANMGTDALDNTVVLNFAVIKAVAA